LSNEQILTKAIRKFRGNNLLPFRVLEVPGVSGLCVEWTFPDSFRRLDHYFAIIYSHDFAKALWGDRFINPEMRDDTGSRVIAIKQTAWRYHLRQMVTADDPIEYLGDHL
jgi:hypothetical protein